MFVEGYVSQMSVEVIPGPPEVPHRRTRSIPIGCKHVDQLVSQLG